MHTTDYPQINAAELKAVRDFLTGGTDELRLPAKPARRPSQSSAAVPVHHGISRARTRTTSAAE